VLAAAKAGAWDAVVTEVTGAAYITGIHQFTIDAADPLRDGFLVETI
jgi:proline racemase